jgi:hypothetical protein
MPTPGRREREFVGAIGGLQMPTQEEIVAMLRSTYDMRAEAAAKVKKADADEAAIDELIAACGFDADALVRKAYNEDDEDDED